MSFFEQHIQRNLKEFVAFSKTLTADILQIVSSITDSTLKASPFLPHILILCTTFVFILHLIQTESTTLPQQILLCSVLLTTITIIVTSFSILRILEKTWYIKAKVSISRQPKALVFVDFEPFDWAHVTPPPPPPHIEQEEPQNDWDNWN